MKMIAGEPIVFKPTPLEDISLALVNHYIEQYRAGNSILSASAVAVAKAAIALQEAYARKDYQLNTTDTVEVGEAERYEKAFARANDTFNGGFPRKGVMWGVARNQLPRTTHPGEYITVHYKFLNEIATAAGLVVVEHQYPQGKGVIIKLMETNNGFNLGEHGWIFAALWIPTDRSGMAGFLY